MKIDKQLQKNCISTIKKIALREGYKKIQNTIYKIENGNVVAVDFLIVNSEYLIYRINIKKESFDRIFWQIMKMEENLDKNVSLRINGAFTAPSILIDEGKMELSENIEGIAENFLKKVNEKIKSFVEKNDVVQYIFSGKVQQDIHILECLSYFDLNSASKAKEIAERCVNLGDKGRFENEGKGFFELVMLYN